MSLTSPKQLRWALTGLMMLLSVWGMVSDGLAHAFATHPSDAMHSAAQVQAPDGVIATPVSRADAECVFDGSSLSQPESDTAPEEHALFHCACVGCALPSSTEARLTPPSPMQLYLAPESQAYASHHPELNIPPIIASI